MLCTGANTNPPPGAMISRIRFTSSRTSSGVPLHSVDWVSIPPPQVLAEFLLQLFEVHVLGRKLYRIVNIETRFDQIGKDGTHRTACVHKILRMGHPLLVVGPDTFKTRNHQPAQVVGGDERRAAFPNRRIRTSPVSYLRDPAPGSSRTTSSSSRSCVG